MREAWERLVEQRESARAYQAFLDYAQMGVSRSLRSLHEIYIERADSGGIAPPTTSDKTLFSWSMKYSWVERAAAWDQYQQRLQIEANNEEIRVMAERHAKLAMLGQSRALAWLQAVDGKMLNPQAAIRLLDVATRLERSSRGEPESISSLKVEGGEAPIKVQHELQNDDESIAEVLRILAESGAFAAGTEEAAQPEND